MIATTFAVGLLAGASMANARQLSQFSNIHDRFYASRVTRTGSAGVDSRHRNPSVQFQSGPTGFGGSFQSESGSVTSSTECHGIARGDDYAYVQGAVVHAVVSSIDTICHPDLDDHIQLDKEMMVIWDVPAFAIAEAFSAISAQCVSNGDSFGCASAEAVALAASATTGDAYAEAFAEAFSGCRLCNEQAPPAPCPESVDAELCPSGSTHSWQAAYSYASGYAQTKLNITATAVAHTQGYACTTSTLGGTEQVSNVDVYANCYAQAYALLSAKAMADGFAEAGPNICTLPTHVDTWIAVTTEAQYTETAGCATYIESGGNAGGSTGDSGAEGSVIPTTR